MKLTVKGKVIKILEVESGISKAGKSWQKQQFVIDNGEEYNSTLAIDVFGDKTQMLNSLSIGDDVTCECNIGSREYQGKYYHNVGLWNLTKENNEVRKKVEMVKEKTGLITETIIPQDDDDLPF